MTVGGKDTVSLGVCRNQAGYYEQRKRFLEDCLFSINWNRKNKSVRFSSDTASIARCGSPAFACVDLENLVPLQIESVHSDWVVSFCAFRRSAIY